MFFIYLLLINLFYVGSVFSLEHELVRNVDDIIQYVRVFGLDKLRTILNMKNIDFNEFDNIGRPLLCYACENKNYKMVEILLESKLIDINIQNIIGYTPLMISIKNRDYKMFSMLIQYQPDLNIQSKLKLKTALMLAIDMGMPRAIKKLIDLGADLNIVDRDGNTAFILALKRGFNTEILKRFLDMKSLDLNICNNKNKNALLIAINKKYLAVTHTLISLGAKFPINMLSDEEVELIESCESQEKESDDINCSICLDSNDMIILSCGHEFHKACIDKWSTFRSKKGLEVYCPMCRKSIE